MGRWLKEMAKVWGMGENKRQAQEASRDELEKGNWTICSLVSTRLCPRHYQRPPAGGRGSSKEGPAPTRSIGKPHPPSLPSVHCIIMPPPPEWTPTMPELFMSKPACVKACLRKSLSA
ncbi:hypothetical protein CBS147333_9601 [Penicillium roqueforti]|nr:hypothetical protein CBS147332_784 [Penicillium roqueforti]KAI3096248.1 hypothetical protein CBS147333_9601 [Penicillium roqueforti]KAI3105963.1 hypothetical protein CBS147331_6672 [Penicillium roqueforti]KAI3201938.1 hypothetical protein CBS147311_4926 [Penicillium roqueforti]KAI3267570.1 hypothetical protein CBS147308_6431 [Penicillium roqueforti]